MVAHSRSCSCSSSRWGPQRPLTPIGVRVPSEGCTRPLTPASVRVPVPDEDHSLPFVFLFLVRAAWSVTPVRVLVPHGLLLPFMFLFLVRATCSLTLSSSNSYFICNCRCRICNFDWWCPNLYISSTRITSANCVLQLIVIYIALIEVFMLLRVLKHVHLSHYATTLYIVGIFLKYMMHHKNDTH